MEIEVKVLDIDPEQIRLRLQAAGCVFQRREFQQNYMYDYPDRRLYETQDGSYIRLRRRVWVEQVEAPESPQRHEEILLTYKRVVSREAYKIADETETTVGDLDTMERFLTLLGLVQVRVDEKLRETYHWEQIHFEIDEWAGLPPYLEVEAESEAEVARGLGLLGYTLSDSTSRNLREVLAMYNIDSDCLRFADFGRSIEF